MRINAEFRERALVRPDDHRWVPSPMAGVSRMMLDRIGDEIARATSFVRYAPNSEFPPHEHGGGEEIFVLTGEFADEHGRYPAGTYLRNPVGTRHAPRVGESGADIFVKLHQFDRADQRHFALDTRVEAWLPGSKAGLSVMPLHHFDGERVTLLKLGPGFALEPRRLPGGGELLVLDGELRSGTDRLPEGSWLRLPPGAVLEAAAGREGCEVYLKTGHLANPGRIEAGASAS